MTPKKRLFMNDCSRISPPWQRGGRASRHRAVRGPGGDDATFSRCRVGVRVASANGARKRTVTRRLQRFRQVLEGARARRGRRADGGLQRHAGLVQRRRALPRRGGGASPRGRAAGGGGRPRRRGGRVDAPGAAPVPAREQLARVLEVVRYAAGRGACVSIDTASPEVAAACLDAGACAVNDVSCLRDAELARVAAASGAALVLMHARGTQEEMRGFSAYPDDAYGDVVEDVLRRVGGRGVAGAGRGLARDALVMDPGLGFAKNARQSLELLASHGRDRRAPWTCPSPSARAASRSSPSADRRHRPGRAPRAPRSPRPSMRHASGAAIAPRPRRARHRAGHRPRRADSREGDPRPCSRASSTCSRGGRSRPVAHRPRRHPPRHLRRLPRAARPARHAGDADGHRASGVIFLVYVVSKWAGLRHALQPAQRAALVHHPHRRRRLPERHPPRAHARGRARVPRRPRAAAGVARPSTRSSRPRPSWRGTASGALIASSRTRTSTSSSWGRGRRSTPPCSASSSSRSSCRRA